MVSCRFKVLLICSSLAMLLLTSDLQGGQPVLSGRVFLATPRGNSVLTNVKVRLLVPGTNDVKAQTYSDSRGRYAFYQVDTGSYEVQFMLGNSVLKQKVGNQRKERVVVQLSPAASKIVDATVFK